MVVVAIFIHAIIAIFNTKKFKELQNQANRRPQLETPVYMPVIQPFENITFEGPTLNPPNTVEASEAWVETDCHLKVDWVFKGFNHWPSGDLTWDNTIDMSFSVINRDNPDNPVEVALDPVDTPVRDCKETDQRQCTLQLPNRLKMRASPQHLNRLPWKEATFSRSYIQFYYGEPGQPGFMAFHTDSNGNPEDDYHDQSRIPWCTRYGPRQPTDQYSFKWVGVDYGVAYPTHRKFFIDGREYFDGDAVSFECTFPCPRL
ncbi:hypothetical protein TWF281_002383 [Arthrobotrys megalospora]